jgi:hypothetical protein
LVPGYVDLAWGQSAESANDYATAMFCYLKSDPKGAKSGLHEIVVRQRIIRARST